MPRLRISVALCSCNGEKYIHEQLDSIANQTRLPDELVIRDDASTDRTADIINSFARTVSFQVRLSINEHRLGSTKNFEQSIRDSNGDIIVLADQDDVWKHDKLMVIENTFNENPEVEVVFSDALIVDETLKPLGFSQWESIRFLKRDQIQIESRNAVKVLIRYNMVQGAAMAFRRQLCDRALPIPADVMHDAWIALIAGITGSIKPIRTSLLMYRQHGNNQFGSSTQSGILANVIKIMHTERARHVRTIRVSLRLYEQLVEHLQSTDTNVSESNLNSDVGKKINHMRRRLHIVERRSKWFALWFREFVFMRYRKYSVGIWSAGYDLLTGCLAQPDSTKATP